ncbi:ATP-binding protein [Gracilibacillus sp. JCM 18860]|uniref:ATP-binding protein n=1 Tax=Gracilibacillus sp. JCM 18860 TaxID=1306159 RepID=UPI0006D018DF
MLIKNKRRVSLRRYWTSRYLLTLCIGLIVIALISAFWIRHTTLENRLNMMTIMAESMADRIVSAEDEGPEPGRNDFFREKEGEKHFEIDPFTYIIDTSGAILSSNRPGGPMAGEIHSSVLENDDTIQQFTLSDTRFYVVKYPIEIDGSTLGWVVMFESKQNLSRVNQEYTQLAIMIIGLAILGWAAIYFLSKRLSKPIQEVAKAAKQVEEGNYQIDLPNESKEKEVHELIHSFKEMAYKLEKLEALRTELLAGVTHELKTPVTSISGLLQAMKDEVVTGEEAKEFLTISLNEADKMKKMVEDLLAFNQFAANAFDVNMEVHDINDVVETAVYSWNILHEDMKINLTKLKSPTKVNVDPIRLQQIMTNLLNNAKQAMENHQEPVINIRLQEDSSQINIDVEDCGRGIPKDEQPFIFERFYRGEEKKYKMRGLGLGLPLSKMIAQVQGGRLNLAK